MVRLVGMYYAVETQFGVISKDLLVFISREILILLFDLSLGVRLVSTSWISSDLYVSNSIICDVVDFS